MFWTGNKTSVPTCVPFNNGQVFKTIQIPTTLPTMDELIGRESDINGFLCSSLKEGLNVHTVHAEVEGGTYFSMFEGFLKEVCRRGVEFVSMREVAAGILNKGLETIPHLQVTRQSLLGRGGWVACRGNG